MVVSCGLQDTLIQDAPECAMYSNIPSSLLGTVRDGLYGKDGLYARIYASHAKN